MIYETFYAPVCTECGKSCGTKMVDFGVGVTEFWGQKSDDTNVHQVSDCCEADVMEAE